MRYCILIFLSVISIATKAQYKPLALFNAELGINLKDSANKSEMSRPRKATLLSAVVPGAGQIYNGKYWKAGVVYAGTAGLIYMFYSSKDSMQNFQQAYVYRLDGDSTTNDFRYSFLTDASVKSYRDYYRRLRDISILGFFGLYAIQIIDANVDAHLYEFKVNKDLSMRIVPEIVPQFGSYSSYSGLKLSLQF